MPAHRRADRKRPLTAPRKGPAVPPPTTGRISPPGDSKPPFLDRLPFRRKLNVLVIVPLAVVSAMLSFVILGQVDRARSAADTAQLVRDSAQVARLIDGVQSEHRQALLVSLHYEAAPSKDSAPDTSKYLRAQHDVSSQVAAVRSAYGDRLPDGGAKALKELEGLDSLRQSVASGPLPASNIDPAYGSVIKGLINGLGLGGEGGDSGSDASSLLDALLRADTAHASFETSVFAARTRDPSALMEYTRAVRDFEQYTYQAERFTRLATQEQGAELAATEHSPYQGLVEQHFNELQADPGNLVAENAAQLRAALADALDAEPTYESQAQNRLKITQSLIGQIAGDTESASQRAWGQVVLLGTGTVLAFAAWFLFSVLVRRSVVRTVRTLTEAAQDVADAAGKELARVADDDADDASPPRLTAVPVPVRDELGELAEAFNQVQLTATALLERQVMGRRNIATMFGNVGHRVSNLTTRQLALIDSVERGETDPETLERLYRIDHIAVRLQRNADSLMLLAGIRESALGAEPMRLSNIVRAALGQIEGYQRVTPHAEGDVTVAPDIVGDLTLMLAELLENAVQFSPASSSVEVVLRPRPDADGALVEIVDHGLGMNAERLAEENARLIRRERLDLAPTEVLGLFVVGGLSRRWGIEVTLSRTPGGGVTATVVLPGGHLVHGAPVGPPARAPKMLPPSRRPGAGHPRPARVEPAPGASALPRRVPSAQAPGRQAPGSPAPAGPSGHVRLRAPAPSYDEDLTHTRTTHEPPAQGAPAPPRPDEASGPLRRRVRGATLGTTTAAGRLPRQAEPPQRPPTGWHPADAEAARSEIDEFEAAVRRAERDSVPEPEGMPGHYGEPAPENMPGHYGEPEPDPLPGRHGVPEHSSTPRTRPTSPEGMSE